jgi:hypothetical protein
MCEELHPPLITLGEYFDESGMLYVLLTSSRILTLGKEGAACFIH